MPPVLRIRIKAENHGKFGCLQGAAIDAILVYAPFAETQQAAKIAVVFSAECTKHRSQAYTCIGRKTSGRSRANQREKKRFVRAVASAKLT